MCGGPCSISDLLRLQVALYSFSPHTGTMLHDKTKVMEGQTTTWGNPDFSRRSYLQQQMDGCFPPTSGHV